MKYYINHYEVSREVFDIVLRLEAHLFDVDAEKYIEETHKELENFYSKDNGIYNGITKLSFSIEKEDI